MECNLRCARAGQVRLSGNYLEVGLESGANVMKASAERYLELRSSAGKCSLVKNKQ